MNISIIMLLLFGLIPSDQQNAIQRIFQSVSHKTQNIKTLSYESSFQLITPMFEKSIRKSTGKIWLQLLPKDTIFGCRFHVQGEDEHSKFDYYYDGQNSYEIRHKEHLISIFNPYAFPNDNHNPAKVRTAILPFSFNLFLIDTNLFQTLKSNATKITLKSEPPLRQCAITFDYESINGKDTKIFSIDTLTFRIRRIETRSFLRGTHTRTQVMEISNYLKNDPSHYSNIIFDNQYEEYKKEFRATNALSTKSEQNTLVGEKAPLFSASSFSGKTLSLAQLKGKIVMLNFWEPWCGYCLLTFQKVNEFQNKYRHNDVVVIGVSSENLDIVKKRIESNKPNYENVFVDTKVISKYKIIDRPTYFLINRDGQIVDVTIGDLEKIESSLQKLIN
jgi:thiol-disulfide isomerase/thioredoxin